jgi:hypothetical protein
MKKRKRTLPKIPWILLAMMALCWGASSALATILPVEVPAAAASSDSFAVTRQSPTSELLVEGPLRVRGHVLVNFPETGVYRVAFRQGTKVVWHEDLFVQLTESPVDRLVRLEWRRDSPGLYRLDFSKQKVRIGTGETQHNHVYLRGGEPPWMLRIHQGRGHAPVEGLQLTWVTFPGLQPRASDTPLPNISFDPSARDDDQVVAEPDYHELLEEADVGSLVTKVSESKDLPPLERQHRIFSWIKLFQESFRVDRRDRYASQPSQGVGSGIGGFFYVTPTLQTQVEFESHVTQTEYEAVGTESPAAEQFRFRLRLGAGVDVLNLEVRRHNLGLEIGPQLTIHQIPLARDNQRVSDPGLGVSLSLFEWQMMVELRTFQSQSHEMGMRWILPWSYWGINPFLGLYQRMTWAKSGDVKARFEEKALWLGLDREF